MVFASCKFKAFLQNHHQATLVVATKEWPGWFEGERVFVAERMIPPLSTETGALLLRQLGLTEVPLEHLQRASDVVGGIPLCLEWVASLVQEPMLQDEWHEDDEGEDGQGENGEEDILTRRLLRLLDDASLFAGPIANKLTPLLECLIEKRLSPEAYQVLCTLAFTPLPVGKPALQLLCPHPRLLKELSAASLLMAYPHRTQLLPMVAATVRSRLSPEQKQQRESQLMEAYLCWLNEGKADNQELGTIIAELATLYLKHHRLLDAAELILYHGWLSSRQGQALRLAKFTQTVLSEFDWRAGCETECGGLLLYYYLLPYIGLKVNDQERAEDHQKLLSYILAGKLTVKPLMEIHLIHIIMLYHMNANRFDQAQHLLNECFDRMKSLLTTDFELHAMLLSKRAWLFRKWSEYAQAQNHLDEATSLRKSSLESYERCVHLLHESERETNIAALRKFTLKKKLATFLNNLSCRFSEMGRFEEALQAIEQCIELQKQGHVDFGDRASSYGEKSQILMHLGRFQEALYFDERARTEVKHCATTGDTRSQEEIWIYQINQGRLYLRLGRIDEAEHLLRAATPHIADRRKVYRLFAKESLMEIEQMQRSSHPHQLDWRWTDRYRQLDAYDAYWWWTPAGSFTEEEREQWNKLSSSRLDEAAKSQLGALLVQSRDREVKAALAEHREPLFHYPALDIDETQRRIAGFLQLDAEIARDEPNAIVRHLYQGAIADELCFIRAIEATYEGNSDRFWELNQQLNPPPNQEEMSYALSRAKQVIEQGLQRADTFEISQHMIDMWHTQLHLPFELPQNAQVSHPLSRHTAASSDPLQRMISAQAAKRFFEAVLQEGGFDGWKVVFASGASGIRVDSALRYLFLQESSLSLEMVRDTFTHEILGHVSRSAVGERSRLGLLGVNTKGYAPTEEGLAFYYERRFAELHGQSFDDSGSWLGGLAVGLASGVMTPPQTFSALFTFFESFLLLYRLLWRNDEDHHTAEELAYRRALTRCLRTFRGTPDLNREGICYTRDVVYLRGRLKIEQAIAHNETILARLAVGKVALELLPELQELGIVTPDQSLQQLASDPRLDAYILSFESSEEPAHKTR